MRFERVDLEVLVAFEGVQQFVGVRVVGTEIEFCCRVRKANIGDPGGPLLREARAAVDALLSLEERLRRLSMWAEKMGLPRSLAGNSVRRLLNLSRPLK